MPSERASQECCKFQLQWGVMSVGKKVDQNHGLKSIVHGFWPESENFDSGKKEYHQIGYLKRSRMTQISAP